MSISSVEQNPFDKKNNVPRVSVIIPSYNAASHIENCVKSALAQTYQAIEVIVVDDGSTDNTADVLRPYAQKVRYLKIKNSGPSIARNQGIQHAGGKYIAFLDSDDEWLPRKLERQIVFMEGHPDIRFSFSDCVLFGAQGASSESFFSQKEILRTIPTVTDPQGSVLSRHIHQDLLYENFIVTSGVIVRKDCFDLVEMFDESLFNGQDFDLWFRLAVHYRAGYLPEVLVRKRIHETNISSRKESVLINRIKVRQKVYRMASQKCDISKKARMFFLGKLQRSYADLARWYLVRGNPREAREWCGRAFQLGIHREILIVWLLSLTGTRFSQFFLKGFRAMRTIDHG